MMDKKFFSKFCLNCSNLDCSYDSYENDYFCKTAKVNNFHQYILDKEFKVPKDCPYYLEFVLTGNKDA